MSITRVRETLEKPGCQTVLVVVLCAAFGGSLLFSRGANSGPQLEAREEKPIGTVGKSPVYLSTIQRRFDENSKQVAQQSAQFGLKASPVSIATAYGGAMNDAINYATLNEIANSVGVSLTDERIKDELKSGFDAQLAQMKLQMAAMGALKEGATDAEFEKVFEQQNGKSLKEVRELTEAQIEASLKTDSGRMLAKYDVYGSILMKKFGGEAKFTDDELKKVNDTLTVKRIQTDSKAKADEALAKLGSGASFDSVMDQFSTASAEPGKAKHDLESTLPYLAVLVDKQLEALKPGKAGLRTGVVEEQRSYAIYMIKSAIPNPPKDFTKEKPELMKRAQQGYAGRMIETLGFEVLKKGPIKFTDPGFDGLYQWMGRFPKPTPQEEDEMAKKLISNPAASGSEGTTAATVTRYLALEHIWKKLPADQQAKLAQNRAEILSNMINFSANPVLFADYAEALLKLKDKSTGEKLVEASRSNSSSIDAEGKIVFDKLGKLMEQAQAAGLANDATVAAFQQAQNDWRTAAQQKAIADQKAAQEQAQAEAERKKQEAAAEAERRKNVQPKKRNEGAKK